MAGPIITSDGWTPTMLETAARQREAERGYPAGGLVALIRQESQMGLNQKTHAASENSHASGPLQIQPGTATALGYAPEDRFNGQKSIDMASTILDKALAGNGNKWGNAVQQYWAGSQDGINSHQGGAKAYGTAVSSQLSDDDLIAQGTDFSGKNGHGSPYAAPAAAPSAAAAADPAASATAPEKSDEDLINEGTNFNGASPAVATAPEVPADPYTELKAGMQNIVSHKGSVDDVTRYVRSMGYDPSTMTDLAANVHQGTLTFGNHFQPPKAANPSALDNLQTGGVQGVADVSGSLNQFAGWADKQVPMLGQLDGLVGATPDRFADVNSINMLTRDAYDKNIHGFAAGAGRLAGNLFAFAPFMAAGGSAIGAGLEAAGAAPGVAGFLGGTAGRAIPATAEAAAVPGNLLLRAASLGSAGAATGATGNALTSSASDTPLIDQVKSGAKTGAILGPVMGFAGDAKNAIMQRAAPGIDAATAKLAQLASDKFGIHLDGSQISNSPIVRRLDSQLSTSPLSNTVERDAAQRGAFTQAVGNTFGANAPQLTPQVMAAARDRIGGEFDRVAANTNIHVDGGLMDDLAEIEKNAHMSVTDGEFGPISRQLNDVVSKAAQGDGTISGDVYQRLTKKGSALDSAMGNPNSNIGQFAMQIKGSLDDALERSASPEDLKALQAARFAWKNMKTVEPLVSKSTDGTISPALLNNRVSVNFKNRAYNGAGDLDELAQIGQRFLKPASSSGTAENIRAQNMMNAVNYPLALAGGLGAHTMGFAPEWQVAAAGMGAAAGTANAGKNWLVSKALGSDVYRNRLMNSPLNGNTPPINMLNLLPQGTILGANRLQAQTTPTR